MKIVLLGPVGVGKGTQAQILSEKLSYFHISTGRMIRLQMRAGTELGHRMQGYYDRGELVPDEEILQLVSPNLEPAGRWILDGFPRNIDQARILDRLLHEKSLELSHVMVLEAPAAVLADRLRGRCHSKSTGRTYHLEYNPPPDPKLQMDPGPFVRRSDDTDAASRRQFEVYHSEADQLKAFYAEKELLTEIDGGRPINEVTRSILRAIGHSEK